MHAVITSGLKTACDARPTIAPDEAKRAERSRFTNRTPSFRAERSRRGVSAVEVVVILAILGTFALFLMMALPRQRETGRLASCRNNLMHVGCALALYDMRTGQLPTVPEPGTSGPQVGRSPLQALLDELSVTDLTAVNDPRDAPAKHPNPPRGERRVRGFLCPSDPLATASFRPAPISYRATTGAAPDGRDGAFAPGRRVSLAMIEASDGLGYTAAFAERLVGDGQSGPGLGNYAVTSGPVPATGCPAPDPSSWRGDAGASWLASDWRSTLYNHVEPPGASPSCLSGDGRTASMRATSGHSEGVNVLICDGSVRTMTPRIDPKLWREWAAFPGPTSVSLPNPERKE